jgi:hypothetical protein
MGNNGVTRPLSHRLLTAFPDLTVFCADSGFLGAEHIEAVREGLAAGGSERDVNAAVEDRLVQAILDTPDDMKTRGLYGTFLQDIGSPWWVVIHLQDPEYWAPEEVVQRWKGWFEQGRDDWLAPLLPWAKLFDDSESFDRGFLRRVAFHGPVPDEVAESLTRLPPLALLPLEVQRGHMTGEGAFQILARRRCLRQTTRLEFCSITTTELAHVLASPHLTALEELAFGPCGLGDDAARLLALSPALSGLRSLDFGFVPVSGATHPEPNHLSEEGIAVLGASPHLRQLRDLGVFGNRTFGDAGVRAMLNAPAFRELESLDLRSAGLTGTGVLAIANSPNLTNLRTLRLGGSDHIPEDARKALAASPYRTALEELDVQM